MSSDCPVFALSEEQDALREAVRALADDKIAPRAAEVDRTSEFPWDVSEEVKSRYLAPVARGEAMFSYALPEPEAGSDAAAMRTKAVRSDAGYVLNGVKRWITNAGCRSTTR
jgi:alkylation response protein AidB-like acyl-CoA dehydrogenase